MENFRKKIISWGAKLTGAAHYKFCALGHWRLHNGWQRWR